MTHFPLVNLNVALLMNEVVDDIVAYVEVSDDKIACVISSLKTDTISEIWKEIGIVCSHLLVILLFLLKLSVLFFFCWKKH